MSRRKKKSRRWIADARFELYGLTIIILSIVALSETWGAVGRSLRLMLRFVAGNWDFIIPPLFIGMGLFIMIKRRWPNVRTIKFLGVILLIISILIFVHMGDFTEKSNEGAFKVNILEQTFNKIKSEINGPKQSIGGGLVGAFFFMIFYYLFGHIGTILVNSLFMLMSIMFLTGFTLEKGYSNLKQGFMYAMRNIRQILMLFYTRITYRLEQKKQSRSFKAVEENDDLETNEEIEIEQKSLTKVTQAAIDPITPKIYDFEERTLTNETLHQEEAIPLEENMPVVEMVTPSFDHNAMPYKMPSYNLLIKPKKGSSKGNRDIESNIVKLEQTLKSFGVHARVVDVHRGPAVTRYEIQPDTGVKVSRIVSLTDDLALALAAQDIRMEAPIPGKAAIGIEVPNAEVSMVTLREVLESAEFHENPSKLAVALGRDISGEPIVTDLSKMPHLLVAGATGSGKSVCINSIITSILYKAKPYEVKMMMIDPKMVELNVYNGVPHLLTPVVTDPRKASLALRKVVAEMEKRYELFAQVGARDIERYNQILAANSIEGNFQLPLPYIVVIVDELADLMMVASSDVEDSITRLAQKARACGIHLILATQRPSVDVITGVIKANIPSRIAFGVSSQIDSRTILDMAGAEKLLGKGDMLYLPMGSSKVTRIQGCFVGDREVEAVVNAIKTQQKANYVEEMIPEELPEENGIVMEDELYDRAVQLVIETQTASVSLLQRRLRIGYARAARLIDMMEQNGVVGPYEGSKPREVLIVKQENTHIS